jgi:16S rRNA (guanine527-N7)-methyltransferase
MAPSCGRMFHVKHEAWGGWLELLGMDLQIGQISDLEGYEQLLIERAIPFGMVAVGDRDHLRERHIVDSIRAAGLLGSPAEDVVDLGTGAGLPGVPLAIVRPDLRFRLVDARRRRIAFVELAVDTLRLRNVTIVQGPIEGVAFHAEVCLSRALADPITAWGLAERILTPAGRLLYWAGKGSDPRLGAPDGIQISVSEFPGLADAGPVAIMTRQ